MKNRIRENAKKYFEEELSGEPLYQDLVIDLLTEFAEHQVKLFAIPVGSCTLILTPNDLDIFFNEVMNHKEANEALKKAMLKFITR